MKRISEVTLKRWPSGFVTSAHVDSLGNLRITSTNPAGNTTVRARLDPEEAGVLLAFLCEPQPAASPPPVAEPGAGALAALRAAGWSVAVHNDYRQNGEARTFWLLTHPDGRWIKGEGRTDEEALAQAAAPPPTVPPGSEGGQGEDIAPELSRLGLLAGRDPLPYCEHGAPLLDGAGELLDPPCGCRFRFTGPKPAPPPEVPPSRGTG